MVQKYYKMVEKILQNYPEEWIKNYYINKQDLVIVFADEISELASGMYDNEKNTIKLCNIEALPHELFHMAFRDKTKINKKIMPNGDMYYGNGVSGKIIKDGKKMSVNKGMTEGYIGYLLKKCGIFKGKSFYYFFVDLLISIYGEEILKYPFLNDPIGLLEDERFNDIANFYTQFNKLKEYSDSIILVVNCKSSFDKLFESDDIEMQEKTIKTMETTMINFKKSIISLFEIIINEYKNCDKPNISKNEFIKKLEEFLKDFEYEAAFGFDDDEFSVKENTINIIDEFKNDKHLIKK